MPTLTERKAIELGAKASALEHEFDHWTAWSAAGGDFEKHQSQIFRVTTRLRGALASIRKDLEDDSAAALAQRVSIEQRLLTVHAVWEFFRTRIALRADTYLRPYLQACDEFAWSCYEHARDLYVAAEQARGVADPWRAVKEPPLVFLNGGWSPFAVPRDGAFNIDRPAFNADAPIVGWLAREDFHALIEKLPFPMIGVPWYQVSHLPEALVIGHEMGHVVEADFRLKDAIVAAFGRAAVSAAHRDAWDGWWKEGFADIYGCLAGGPAFAMTLVDFLAGDKSRVEAENPVPGGLYPMPWLRIRIAIETLAATEFSKEAATVEEEFRSLYSWPATYQSFAAEAKSVVGEVLDGPYPTLGGVSLREVLAYPRDALGNAADVDLAANIPVDGSLWTRQPRPLLAAARTLYDLDPQQFRDSNRSAQICGLVVAARPAGTRGTGGTDLQAIEDAEREEGRRWL